MKYIAKMGLLLATFLLVGNVAFAQFTATGNITDTDGEPLIGATILVKGTAVGTVTDFDGNFSLEVPNDPATLIVSYTGYSAQEMEVSGSNKTINLELDSDVANLEEVVVTGFASTVARKNLANTVASIDGDQLTGTTVQSTMDGALYGKLSGVEIRSSSGAPGGGMSIRMRGVTSVFGNQQPLYVVDGVYMDNSSVSLGTNVVTEASGGGSGSTNQDDASNRIADLDPEDIENIEILKGASASAIYGSRAAGGVVIITTKKGKAGQTKVSFAQNLGFSTPITLLGSRVKNVEQVRSIFGDAAAELAQQNGINDYEAELYDNTAILSTSRLEVSGGDKKTTFFVGGTFKDDDGIVEGTGYKKASVRLNIGHKITDWLKVDVSSNYIDSETNRGLFNNGNTNVTVGYALAFTNPWDDLFPDKDGVYPANNGVGSNVLETVNLVTNQENVNRFVGGATVTANLMSTDVSNLKLVLRGGLDQYTAHNRALFPQSLSFFRSPLSLRGVSISGRATNQNSNLSAFLVHSYYTNSGLSFTTQAGVTQDDFDFDFVSVTGTGLNGSQTNVDQSTNQIVSHSRRIQQDKGFFVQEEINFSDKIIATVGVRGDKSSNNGDANKMYYFPKANMAVNLNEFDFFSSNMIEQLKLRVAYGEAGRFANFGDRFNVYNATLIGGTSGLANSTLQGFEEVGPERQAELEFGTDIALTIRNIPISLEATYYIKTVTDLLLQQQVPTSSGFTRKVVNAATLENRGIELGLNATPISGKVTWNTNLRWWKNNSEITELDVPAFTLGGFAASLGTYLIQEGQSATQLVGTYDRADCQTADCTDLDPDGDNLRVYGDAAADFDMSWTNNVSIGNFSFSMLWHWKNGGEGINLSPFLYDIAGLTWDYDDTNLDPTGELTNGEYRGSKNDASPWIEDSSYLRMREIGAYYNIPKSALGDVLSLKLGVSARNLINIFDYNSYDPEVSNFGNNTLANSVEVTPFPSSKTINFHLKATF